MAANSKVMTWVALGVSWRKILDYTHHPPIGYQSVSDKWSFGNALRTVEFKLLQLKAKS